MVTFTIGSFFFRFFTGVLLLASLLSAGCSSDTQTIVDDPRLTYKFPEAADFSGLNKTEAFKAMHSKFSKEYAFGEWKGVDWNAIYNRILPSIERAAADNDAEAYYTALHEYLFSIQDGHVIISAPGITAGLIQQQSGGGFGLALAELDDGRVIAANVPPGGPAALAGMQAGAQIITWNGLPVASAIGSVPVHALAAFYHPMATNENLRLEQVNYLSRAPVGSSVQASWRNPGSVVTSTAPLAAINDNRQSLQWLNFAKALTQDELNQPVLSQQLPSKHGYIKLTVEMDMLDPEHSLDTINRKFKEALAPFIAGQAPGVILDLRGNLGGSDQLAADICGFFHNQSKLYEYQEYYDPRTGKFIRYTMDDRNSDSFIEALLITPQSAYYGGPVVALVSPSTISSGEGIAMCVNNLPQGAVLGFHGTWGSFGMMGGVISLPGGITLKYPHGQSVDANGVVQLDSRNGIGGVLPKVRVPKTYANVMSFARGNDVELEYAVSYLNGIRR